MAYTGPGDIVAGAAGWWGLRGYSAAYSTGTNPCVDVVDAATGLITTTINILANGNMDQASVIALGYAVKVKKLYDQSGNGQHLTQATLATMPVLTPNGVGSLPCLTYAGAQELTNATFPGFTQNQPITVSAVVERTGTFTTENDWFVTSTGGFFVAGFLNSANTIFEFAGGGVSSVGSIADGSLHVIQTVFNNAGQSIIYVDGVNNNVSSSGANPVSGPLTVGGSNFLTGIITEVGDWGVAFSGANLSAMNSNQTTYWITQPSPATSSITGLISVGSQSIRQNVKVISY